MKVFAVTALLCAITVTYASVPTFNAYDEAERDLRDIMKILMRPRTPERYMTKSYFEKYGISSKPVSFSFKNCTEGSSYAEFVGVQVTPDPIVIPGQIGIKFDLDVIKQFGSPLQTSITIKKKVLFAWITIPCVDQVGSCSYDDLCEILDTIAECPQPFIDNHVPCKCPFDMGNYTLPETKFELDTSFPLPSGDYSAQIKMATNGANVACYDVTLTLK